MNRGGSETRLRWTIEYSSRDQVCEEWELAMTR